LITPFGSAFDDPESPLLDGLLLLEHAVAVIAMIATAASALRARRPDVLLTKEAP
jgi:hypothetical protein